MVETPSGQPGGGDANKIEEQPRTSAWHFYYIQQPTIIFPKTIAGLARLPASCDCILIRSDEKSGPKGLAFKAAQPGEERMQRSDDADTKMAFLFEEDGTTMRAVAWHQPPDSGRGWRFVQPLELDVRHSTSAGMDPQSAIGGLLGEGFYMWDAGKAS